MARLARQISESGLYHIVFRGLNKQSIFEEDADYIKMKEIITELKTEMHFEVYVYCFMSNHVHILLKEQNMGDISLIMKRLLTKYARWYNIKYRRSGALIANRYKSQPVEVDEYFMSVVRYIHQNPLKAKMVKNIGDYKWSSYREYLDSIQGLTDKTFVLDMISLEEFESFHQIVEDAIFLVDDKVRLTDDEIRRKILKSYGVEPREIFNMNRNQRNEMLKQLKKTYSIRQLERITGISRGIIHKS